ncbi:MAG: GtrA family protein [Clostridia bacterium]|nr:GtrA family protein [Clostridia bacterium]
MNRIKAIIVQNKKILIYFCCSVCAALLEAGLLLAFKNLIPAFVGKNIVYANTTAILVSSILHFILTSKLVFKVRMNISSAVVYIVTFFIGLAVQNGVIWITYEKLLPGIIRNDTLLTLFCKALSLAASFFITYFIRSILNARLKAKEEKADA